MVPFAGHSCLHAGGLQAVYLLPAHGLEHLNSAMRASQRTACVSCWAERLLTRRRRRPPPLPPPLVP